MKKAILALLVLSFLLPAAATASKFGLGPKTPPMETPQPTGEDLAWNLLEKAMAAASYQEAIDLVHQAASAAPGNGEVLVNCAYALMMLDAGNQYLAESEGYLRAALPLLARREHADAVEMLAQVLILSGKADEAVEVVAEAASQSPREEGMKVLLAAVLYYAGRGGEALAALENLAEDSPRNLDALRLRASILLMDCRWEEALEAYRQIDRGWPDYMDGALGLYQTYVACGRFDRALREIDRMLVYGAEDNSLWLERARLRLWKVLDPTAAIAEAEALLRVDGTWIDAMVVKMAGYLMLEQYDRADAAAEEIASLEPTYGALMGAITAINAGRWADAVAVLSKLAEAYPDQYVYWGFVCLARLDGYDDLPGAREAAARAFALAGAEDDYDLFLRLGVLYRREGNLLEAARAFAEADRLAVDDPLPLYHLTMTCIDAGLEDETLEYLAEMERRYPGWYETMLARVLAEDVLARPEEALASFEALKEKFPHPAKTLLLPMEGVLRANTGDPEGAEIIKARIGEKEAPDALDWNAYALALARLGEYGKARAALDTAVSLIPEGDPEQAWDARLMRITLSTTAAELAFLQGDHEACVAAFAAAMDEGWPPFSLAVFKEYAEVYASDAYQALLATQGPQRGGWDLAVPPEMPK